MVDTFTQLNLGLNGDCMDETLIAYPSDPTARKRARVVITGNDDKSQVANVINTDPQSTDYGLVVRQIPYDQSYPGDYVCQVNSADLVPAEIERTIVSYIVPAGKTFYIAGFSASGNINGTYILYINSVKKLVGRSTAANLNVECSFLSILPTVSESIAVSVAITHHNTGLQGSFDATIIGYTI